MLDTASAWLDSTLKTSEGETVTLHVGGELLEVTAVIGATPIGFDFGTGGAIQSWQTTDFLIEVSELELNSAAFLPETGMQIDRTVNGFSTPYEVRPVEDGRCYRYSDAVARTMLRIHAKEVPGREAMA